MSLDGPSNTNEQIFHLEDAKPEDVEVCRTIVRDAWIANYPNDEYGITREDLEAIDWYKPEKLEKNRREIAEDSNVHVWVLKDREGKIVGFCKAFKKTDYGEIDSMFVLPELQGRGLGKMLMKTALDWLDSNKDIRLTVVKYNNRAIEFYRRMGFQETDKNFIYEGTRLPDGRQVPRIEMIKPGLQKTSK